MITDISTELNVLAAKLKSLRLYHKLTQEECSEKIGVSKATWGLWETQYTIPTLQNFITICKTFNVDANWMIGS